ncbi:MAG: GGDEF domain-containing protein, partial [Eubacteriales bacterium]|nr:GGDEF domain-containing protein [Eubacteriales bacterium]
KKAELLTLERAETDPLTGVLNRAAFIEQVDRMLQTAKPNETHALFMLDVDDFKHINDALGHGAGDQVLRETTGIIGGMLRHDDLIGRLGGDEFFVFLKGLSMEAAAAKAREMAKRLKLSVKEQVSFSCSIGVAMFPQHGTSFDTLYQHADDALYEEKKSGKGGFRVYQELPQE